MREILVCGASGVGKSIYVEALERSTARASLSIAVSDHELFTSHKDYSNTIEKVRNRHREQGVDISVLVVNDRGSNLRVDFGGSVPFFMSDILFPR
jgi:broad-specificity NMP kinase